MAAFAKGRGLFNFVAPSVHDTATNTDLAKLSDVGTIVFDTDANQFFGLDQNGAWQSVTSGSSNGVVTSPRAAGVVIASAKITNSGTPIVGQEDGDWLGTVTDTGVGRMSLAINSGIFDAASTPNCICTPRHGDASAYICHAAGITASNIDIYSSLGTGSTGIDIDLTIICIGYK